MELLQKIVNKLSTLDYIDAICLSGSRTGIIYDEKSDFDIYIYSSSQVDVGFREKLAKKYSAKSEVNNDFFGQGDEWILTNGIEFDFMYRDITWLNNEITRVWQNYQASTGYSTAFLYNIKTSKVLFEKNQVFSNCQKKLETPYPEGLIKSILDKNYPLLKSKLCSSYYEQIRKAIERKDFVSVNHRTSALLASYFDILFAINKIFNPGEKKLVNFVEKTCTIIPKDFKSDVEAVILAPASEKLACIDKLLEELKLLLINYSFLQTI